MFFIDQLIDPYGSASSSSGGKFNEPIVDENQKNEKSNNKNQNNNNNNNNTNNKQKQKPTVSPLPYSTKVKIISDICGGLSHLHNLNIVHGDIKPQNVLLDLASPLHAHLEQSATTTTTTTITSTTKHSTPTKKNKHKQEKKEEIVEIINNKVEIKGAKISDMGLAKKLAAEQHSFSSSNAGRGTIGWQSPEQILGQRVSRKSDVFALGCLIYYVLMDGHHPFGEVHDLFKFVSRFDFEIFSIIFLEI